MIASMTGFGAASGVAAGISLRIEIRTVNHRGLDISTRLPAALSVFEPATTTWCRSVFARGHIEISVRAAANEIPLGTDKLFASRAASLRGVMAACGLPNTPTLRDLLAFGLPADEPRDFDEPTWQAFRVLLDRALDQVRATREREGQSLWARLQEIVGRIAVVIAAVRDRYGADLAAFRQRHEARLSSHGGLRAPHDKEPVSLLVFGRDATEEIDRLDAHVAEVRRALDATGPVGRRLDFLATEMLREAGTLTSKCPSPELSQQAIDLRCELERLREQAQNVE